MGDDHLYELIVDEVYAELDEKEYANADEAYTKMRDVEYEMQDRLSVVLDEIFDEYIEERGLEWDE